MTDINTLNQRQFPQPLPATMTAAQLWHMASLEQDEHPGTTAMYAYKREQTPDEMHKAIAENGVDRPIKLRREGRGGEHAIQDGHHRIASAFIVDPEMPLPVEWER